MPVKPSLRMFLLAAATSTDVIARWLPRCWEMKAAREAASSLLMAGRISGAANSDAKQSSSLPIAGGCGL